MKASKIQIGAKVNGKAGSGIISKIITKSTGYVEVSYDNGTIKKEMAFNLTNENGESLKSAPKKQASEKLTPIQEMQQRLMWINGSVYGDRNSMSYQMFYEDIAKLEMNKNVTEFIKSVCKSCVTYMRVSEKQAYWLAKFATENNITL